MYISEEEMLYEIIISQGKGYPTENLKIMFYLICLNLSKKMKNDMDYTHTAYIELVEKLYKFNLSKYDKPFRYYTEIAKRNMADTKNNSFKFIRGYTGL
jgi:hypothetical protein